MSGRWLEWLHLVLRWTHVVAGAFWIGQTAFFTWLDVQSSRAGSEVWMVHSGGFYRVERVFKPGTVPGRLHWFRWEAAASWVSGILLLNLVYYHGGAMVAAGSGVSALAAGAIGAATLVVGWIVYDALWLSPLQHRERLGAAI